MSVELSKRPRTVVLGSVLMLGSALALILAWAFGIDAVDSNGARVFSVILWLFLSWNAYCGAGWVRFAIFAIFGIAIWGAVNSPSLDGLLAGMAVGEIASKALALGALVVLFLPGSGRYFSAAAAAAKQERADG